MCVLFPLGVGSAFSVTGLSCVNYTAEFSWRIFLLFADSQLELSCNNGTNVRNIIQSSVYCQGADFFYVALDIT